MSKTNGLAESMYEAEWRSSQQLTYTTAKHSFAPVICIYNHVLRANQSVISLGCMTNFIYTAIPTIPSGQKRKH